MEIILFSEFFYPKVSKGQLDYQILTESRLDMYVFFFFENET